MNQNYMEGTPKCVGVEFYSFVEKLYGLIKFKITNLRNKSQTH